MSSEVLWVHMLLGYSLISSRRELQGYQDFMLFQDLYLAGQYLTPVP